jgi:hypothetical protein
MTVAPPPGGVLKMSLRSMPLFFSSAVGRPYVITPRLHRAKLQAQNHMFRRRRPPAPALVPSTNTPQFPRPEELTQTLVVTYSKSLTPGEAVHVADPLGCHFRCTVPPGLRLGESFHVKVPVVVPAAADPTGGRRRGLCFLQLQVAAADPDTRIVLAAVEQQQPADADADAANLWVQLFLSDRSSLGPALLEGVTARELLSVLPQSARLAVRSAQSTTGVPDGVQLKLPRLVLSAAEAACLQQHDQECPICLTEFSAEDELVCLPCAGQHKAHWECLQPWLKSAQTCPTCRFVLPTSDTEAAQAEHQQSLQVANDAIAALRRDAAQFAAHRPDAAQASSAPHAPGAFADPHAAFVPPS